MMGAPFDESGVILTLLNAIFHLNFRSERIAPFPRPPGDLFDRLPWFPEGSAKERLDIKPRLVE
jgi:hypothetical protein